MYPEYKLIQIVELPRNGETSPYAVREYARMEYFDFDFMCKNAIKKFMVDHSMESGEYLIIRDNEKPGDTYIVEAICVFRVKDSGNYIDFKRPGEEWVDLVRTVMDGSEIIPLIFKIQTMHKMTIPKIGGDNIESDPISELREQGIEE
ncbi:hypothetical protein H6B11_10800 [Mediterraneibacter glycyrrhizinilyticus]|nr:hypothetical protein [Mediterraneibacter glycyrrhizinilyticus]MBM6854639.1 hypothetical protein [Mediterraneibacter glycyrrhizinilyticus]